MKLKFVNPIAVAVLMSVAAFSQAGGSSALPAAPGTADPAPTAPAFNPNAKVAAINVEQAIFLTNEGQRDMQVGFARVITDYATFAYLADVFIIESHRGRELSKFLMECIIKHPHLQGLRRWTLATRDAHGLYEQFGFKPLSKPDRFMEIHNPEVYKRSR